MSGSKVASVLKQARLGITIIEKYCRVSGRMASQSFFNLIENQTREPFFLRTQSPCQLMGGLLES